jgi:hypothetical protein
MTEKRRDGTLAAAVNDPRSEDAFEFLLEDTVKRPERPESAVGRDLPQDDEGFKRRLVEAELNAERAKHVAQKVAEDLAELEPGESADKRERRGLPVGEA